MFHINACFLNKNFDSLEYLLKCVNQELDVVAVTENRITRNDSFLCYISLKIYAIDSIPAQVSVAGMLLLIANL